MQTVRRRILEYPGMDARRVLSTGKISWGGSRYFITTSLAGWSVGLKHLAEGRLEVRFGRCWGGGLSPGRKSFQRGAEDRPLEAGQP